MRAGVHEYAPFRVMNTAAARGDPCESRPKMSGAAHDLVSVCRLAPEDTNRQVYLWLACDNRVARSVTAFDPWLHKTRALKQLEEFAAHAFRDR